MCLKKTQQRLDIIYLLTQFMFRRLQEEKQTSSNMDVNG